MMNMFFQLRQKMVMSLKKVLKLTTEVVIITSTEPNPPLNDADHVGSFFV